MQERAGCGPSTFDTLMLSGKRMVPNILFEISTFKAIGAGFPPMTA